MANLFTLSDFRELINALFEGHEQLTEQLMQAVEALNFTLSRDLSEVKASELQGQLGSIHACVEAAEQANAKLQERLRHFPVLRHESEAV